MDITFRCKGGAHASYLEIPPDQKTFDMIMFVIGSNDLSNGKGVLPLYNEMIGYAKQYLEKGFCSRVVIMTLLPRSNQWYMERMRQFNSMLTSNTNNTIVGWYWSKPLRRHMALLHDGVHLTDDGYRKAVKYLGSPIFYFYKPSSKSKRYYQY